MCWSSGWERALSYTGVYRLGGRLIKQMRSAEVQKRGWYSYPNKFRASTYCIVDNIPRADAAAVRKAIVDRSI